VKDSIASLLSPKQRRERESFKQESEEVTQTQVIEEEKVISGGESEVEKEIKQLMVTHNSAYGVFLKSQENTKLF
jgi:hypothetical protein